MKRFIAALTLSFFCIAQPAHAQWAVIDVAAIEQLILEVARLETQIEIMRQNIERGISSWRDIVPFFRKLEELLRRGEALTHAREDIGERFDKAYDNPQLEADPEAASVYRTRVALDTLRASMVSAREHAKEIEEEHTRIAELKTHSDSAPGALAVLQIGNLISIEIIGQLQKLREAGMAHNDAVATYYAKKLKDEEAQKKTMTDAIDEAALGGWPTAPVTPIGKLQAP